MLREASVVWLRTARHPSAYLAEGAESFDYLYESASSLDDVYTGIVDRLVATALAGGTSRGAGEFVAYAVPGSPVVAERSVELLRADSRVQALVLPAVSFADLAFERLGVDPFAAGAHLVDGQRFAAEAAGRPGPFLVGQCDSPQVLSEVKLAIANLVDNLEPTSRRAGVVVLQHLGLPDEAVFCVPWYELDRCFEPDHLTSLWVPDLGAPFAAEMVRLEELGRTLRQRCPWDRQQTHLSLRRYLLEEVYEALEAIEELPAERQGHEPYQAPGDAAGTAFGEAGGGEAGGGEAGGVATAGGAAMAYEHLEEELGDVLFQVVFHSVLATEEGQFTLADVARRVHDKLVRRHPHVFGGLEAVTPEDVSRNWERVKREERRDNSSSLMDQVPRNLPALLYAHKAQARAASVGFDWAGAVGPLEKVREELAELVEATGRADRGQAVREEMGDLLFAAVNVARKLKLDPEATLRDATAKFSRRFRAMEELARSKGLSVQSLELERLDELWEEVKAAEPTSWQKPVN